MTRVLDDPATFAEDMLTGFVDAYPHYVRAVPGGVVRAAPAATKKVAVVVGGGSGHYPAFCGLVGDGLADGAVVGNVFTSPSAEQAYAVARQADRGGGVLFTFGNYAGDVLNFGLAADRLREAGVETATALVTDDVASAPPAERAVRRGVAGDFVVFKVAAAAAEAGYDLDQVARVARHTNDRTVSIGVAFAGCTMPGQDKPLFTVPAGAMGVGLGIHGEPGISETAMCSAAELAEQLVGRLVVERPVDAGNRVAVILNGLGTTKYEELFVTWRTAADLLRAADLTIVEPEVGEFVTSLDMAGCSLTLTWLDDELERFWRAPADTPAYRKHRRRPSTTSVRRRETVRSASSPTTGPSVVDPVAAIVVVGLRAALDVVVAAEDELGRLDAVAGDGDHGRGMVRGLSAAVAAADGHASAGAALAAAGDAWAARAGGTSGALWGSALRAAGRRLGDGPYAFADVAACVRSAATEVQRLGRAEPGDKTMLDAMLPFVEEFEAASGRGQDVMTAWRLATDHARRAADETAALRPRVGRARPLADRSVGTADPGATSFALCVGAVGAALARDV